MNTDYSTFINPFGANTSSEGVACYAETKTVLLLQSEMQRLINIVRCDVYQVKQVETVTVTNNPVSNLDSTPQTV